MVTAKEFYTKRNKIANEQGQLDQQIMRAYSETANVVSPLVDGNGYIDSPFKLEYEVENETMVWLEKNGWKLENNKICPINSSDML